MRAYWPVRVALPTPALLEQLHIEGSETVLSTPMPLRHPAQTEREF